MQGVAPARSQLAIKPLQRQQPFPGRRAALAGSQGDKRLLEQTRDRTGQRGKRQGVRRRLHRLGGGVLAEGEAVVANGAFNRQVALAPVTSGEWVAAHEQQVEAEQRQAERIVIRAAPQAAKRPLLQLRGGKLRHADFTEKEPLTDGNLERIAVDQLDQRLGRHHHIAGIDIANDMTSGMDSLKGAGQITGGVHQKRPVGLGKGALAMRGTIEAVNLLIAADPGHNETLDRAVRTSAQHIHRPGGNRQQAGMGLAGHALQLQRLVGVHRLVIALGDETGPAHDLVNRAFTAAPQLLAQLHRMIGAANQPHQGHLPEVWMGRSEGDRRPWPGVQSPNLLPPAGGQPASEPPESGSCHHGCAG